MTKVIATRRGNQFLYKAQDKMISKKPVVSAREYYTAALPIAKTKDRLIIDLSPAAIFRCAIWPFPALASTVLSSSCYLRLGFLARAEEYCAAGSSYFY